MLEQMNLLHLILLSCIAADKVHVATWGLMDHIQETMTMTLAIPGTSLRDLLGLSKLPSDFNFKVLGFQTYQLEGHSMSIMLSQTHFLQLKGGIG